MTKLVKSFNGVVVSSGKMDKTIQVEVKRIVPHYKYGKNIKKTSKFLVHDENNESKVGDSVIIRSCRPKSKSKYFELDNNLSQREN